ncbi:DarT ssDNA thymidine ADP-ribosyltransferase family protein [Agromyces larvae]|uniref:DUF4433 domain-containing protein n=1 Tax=Agromyces larvae TaxID=2929802 RepID=A0ABY4BZ73_9MICO|nr:DarT ssDNA thymidine ADP-ribosyltransferase family protein [Agromyces larvae]UOE44475.1 DUF4433 domain-containing protein [Agromyces larvae]
MAECIHGFDDGLCAICFPPKQPEPPEIPTRAASARATTTRGSTTRSTAPRTRGARAAAGRTAVPGRRAGELTTPIDVRALRVYHVTHIDNLAGILGAGAVLPDVGDPAATPAVDLAAPAARDFRRSAHVPGTDTAIAEYVPLLLSTNADVWDAVRSGRPDPRLTAEAVERPAAEHVVFVGSVASTLGPREAQPDAVAAGASDAAIAGDEFEVGWDAVERMLRRLARLEESAPFDRAELLVRGPVPLERFSLIAVANDRVRDRVRQALSAVGAKAKVAVYPPWFQPGGGAEA